MSRHPIAPGAPTNARPVGDWLLPPATRRGCQGPCRPCARRGHRPRPIGRHHRGDRGLPGELTTRVPRGDTRNHRAQLCDVWSGWNSLRVFHVWLPPHAQPRVLRSGGCGSGSHPSDRTVCGRRSDAKPPPGPARSRSVQRTRQAHCGPAVSIYRTTAQHSAKAESVCTMAIGGRLARWPRPAESASRQVTNSSFATIWLVAGTCRAGGLAPRAQVPAFQRGGHREPSADLRDVRQRRYRG